MARARGRWRRRARASLLGLAVVALLAEAAFLAVVSQAGFRAWLKGQLEQGGAVSFGSIGGWPFGIRVADVLFETRGPSSLRAFRAPAAYATVEWRPLVEERRLALRSVTLEGAEIDVRLDGGRPEQVALPLPVSRVRLAGCSLRVANLSGWTLLLRRVDASARQDGSGGSVTLSGSLRSAGASIAALVAGPAEADFRLGEGRLEVSRAEAAVYGGSAQAAGTLRLEASQSLEAMRVRASQVDVLALLKGLGYSERFGGRANLEADGEGRFMPGVQAFTGKGRLRLKGFWVQADLPKVNLFNIAPTLKELRRVEGLEGSATLAIAGPRLELTDLALANPDLKVTGAGSLLVSGALSIECRSVLGPRLARGLPGIMTGSLERTPEGGLVVPFRLENTLAQPDANLDAVMKGALLRPFKKIFD